MASNEIERKSTAEERRMFLNNRRLAGRISATEAGFLLGLLLHEVRILVAKGLLQPLGKKKCAPNTPVYFSSAKISELAQDEFFLSKATDAIRAYWRERREGVPRNGQRHHTDYTRSPKLGEPEFQDEPIEIPNDVEARSAQ